MSKLQSNTPFIVMTNKHPCLTGGTDTMKEKYSSTTNFQTRKTSLRSVVGRLCFQRVPMCLGICQWTPETTPDSTGNTVAKETVRQLKLWISTKTVFKHDRVEPIGRAGSGLTEWTQDKTINECHSQGLVQWNFIMENPFPVKGWD